MSLENIYDVGSGISDKMSFSSDILLWISSLLAFITVFLFFVSFVPSGKYVDEAYGYRKRKRETLLKENIIYKLTLPTIELIGYYFSKLPASSGRFGSFRKKWEEYLLRSGYWGAYTVNEYMGLIVVTMVIGFMAGLYLSYILTGAIQFPFAILTLLVSLILPVFALKGAIKNRILGVERELFSVVDLLVLSMRAGLDFVTAMQRVVTQGMEDDPENPMIQELGIVLQEMQMGTARSDAFKNLANRIPSDYLKSMVGAIVQSEIRGTPLATVLEIQMDTIRKKRTQSIEKQASNAAVKILLPLMFIFMSVFAIIGGSMYLKIKSAG